MMNRVSGEDDGQFTYNNGSGTITAWCQDVPEGIEGNKIGVVGEFHADNREAALDAITHALEYLKDRKCVTVLGPMNQNTWHSYRFQVETSLEQPFFMEPAQPAEYVTWFEEAGFTVDEYYYSFSTSLSSFTKKRSSVKEELEKDGIRIEDGRCFEEEELLRVNYEISRRCFTKNVYYTPITYEAYQAIYRPSLSLLKKEYVDYAFVDRKPVAFLFGVPDYNELKKGGNLETMLFKTFAVLPEYQNRGIASALMNCVADAAKENGFTKGIMALVHEKNVTMKMLPNQQMCSHYVLLRRDCIG